MHTVRGSYQPFPTIYSHISLDQVLDHFRVVRALFCFKTPHYCLQNALRSQTVMPRWDPFPPVPVGNLCSDVPFVLLKGGFAFALVLVYIALWLAGKTRAIL